MAGSEARLGSVAANPPIQSPFSTFLHFCRRQPLASSQLQLHISIWVRTEHGYPTGRNLSGPHRGPFNHQQTLNDPDNGSVPGSSMEATRIRR
jgi:hypothetical protein